MPGWKSLIPKPAIGLTGPLHALEDLGPVPYGYVKYRTPFTFNGEPRMFISTRADDAKKVFVNGKFVAEASNTEKLTDFPLAKYAQPGSNLVEISYELFGAPNFGENVGELKGLESAGVGADFASAKGLENWQIQRYAALMRGREVTPEAGVWTPAAFLGGGENQPLVPAFTWCRAKFALPPSDERLDNSVETHLRRRLRCAHLPQRKIRGTLCGHRPAEGFLSSRTVSFPGRTRMS